MVEPDHQLTGATHVHYMLTVLEYLVEPMVGWRKLDGVLIG